MSEMISDIRPLLKILDINIYEETINKDKVQLYDGSNIPFENNSFDISILNLTLHHIPNNLKYFKEVLRVTKNRIILIEETYDNLLQKIHLIFRDWLVNYRAGRSSRLFWNSYFSKKKIKQLILENDLVLTHRYSEQHHGYYKELLVFERKHRDDTENEYIDLVDENNTIIGVTDKETAHKTKQLHRVVGILLFDKEGNIILQSETKYNLIELSVGGHVQLGESYEEAAHREMFEELKIATHLDHLFTFLPANNKMGHFWSVFKGEVPENWEFKQTTEVKNIIKLDFQEFLNKIKNEPHLFTAGVSNVINEYIRVNNLNKL
jgi:isopentenyldiphosphate isomerase